MMTQHEIHLANIRNLTALWRAMGAIQVADRLWRSPKWPRRFWQEPDDQSGSARMLKYLPALDDGYTIPLWSDNTANTQLQLVELAQGGFSEAFRQTTMFLKVNPGSVDSDDPEPVFAITDEQDLRDWGRINEAAFGYEIDIDVIRAIARHPEVSIFLSRSNREPVAAAMLFLHGGVAGIHMLGVSPAFRRQGFARGMMMDLLRHAESQQARYCTLQASPSGQTLYESLGFKQSGSICSYLKQI